MKELVNPQTIPEWVGSFSGIPVYIDASVPRNEVMIYQQEKLVAIIKGDKVFIGDKKDE
jgi:hypothetical protein